MRISIRSGNVDSAIFYSRLLIQGDIILKNTEKAAKILKKFLPTKNSNVYTLYGLTQKEDEEYELALKYFRKASKSGNGEAMYEYAKLVYEGLGTKQNSKKVLQLFEMAKQNNFSKSEQYINLLTDNDEENYQFNEISKIIDVPFDNKQINTFRGIIWYLGKGNPRNSYDKQIIDILASSQYPPD